MNKFLISSWGKEGGLRKRGKFSRTRGVSTHTKVKSHKEKRKSVVDVSSISSIILPIVSRLTSFNTLRVIDSKLGDKLL